MKKCNTNNNDDRHHHPDSSGTDSTPLPLGSSLPSDVRDDGRRGSHVSCRHTPLTATSCPSHALTGSVRAFIIGWTIQLSLNLLKKRRIAFRSRQTFLQEVLLNQDSLSFALFLSNLVLIFRSSSCLLRRLTQRSDHPVNRMISGFLSGFSILWFPSTQITLHAFWKTVFTGYYKSFGKTPASESFMYTFFVVADSFLINCMVMEPRFVPRSYMRLVDSFTGSYLARFNVITMNMLGEADSGFRYGNKLPDLHADHLSKRYLQTIGCWSLEARE